MFTARNVVLLSPATAALAGVTAARSSSGRSRSPAPVPQATGDVVGAQSTSLPGETAGCPEETR